MANTTNFGWETPDDTDLVKDGAAAMRTLGNSIDASFVDLKGGTSGQILSKNSNTDLDYTWITPNVGDITEVQASTGISITSGTGPIPVITNSMATEITASGDIIVGTGSGTFDNLPIGTTGQVLTADTTVSPYKVKWASPAASFSGVRVFNSTALTLTNGAYTQLTFNSESYDTDGYHSTTTNTGRLTPPSGKGGYFYVYCFGILQQTGNAIEAVMRLDNSSSEFARANIYYGTAGAPTLFCSSVQYISDTDYIVANVYINTNANKTFEISGTYGQFGMVRLGA